MESVKRASEDRGQHFFSPGATGFFNSRYSSYAYKVGDQAYFITSERFSSDMPRLYTIRVCNLTTGRINTVGEFQEYKTAREARSALRRIPGLEDLKE